MKTIKYLSIAALALMGIMMTGCSSEDNIINEPQQPASTDNVVTLTTTISLDSSAATTRALTAGGVKTFAEGEQMALVYKNTSGSTVKAVSSALKDGDIASGAKSATFTFTLDSPDKTKTVTYIYPAAMAKDDGSINYGALATQDGTLATLESSLDLATNSAAWNGDNLPTVTLENKLAILALTLKDAGGSNDITSTITDLTITVGYNSYTVTRPAAAGPIYVAIQPISSKDISVTATDKSKIFSKSLTSKTYEKNNGYNVSWKMTEGFTSTIDLSTASPGTVIPSGALVKGTIKNDDYDNEMIFIASGAIVTLSNVTIEAKRPIVCKGNAIIILADGTTNTLTASVGTALGAYYEKTLTIRGNGTLNAKGGIYSPGIGNYDYKEIIIEGGTINAQGAQNAAGIGLGYQSDGGDITIKDGNVTATGGDNAPGIGCGEGREGNSNPSVCGKITISGGSVTANAGENAPYSIGLGKTLGTCGTITIGGTVYYNGTNFENSGDTYLAQKPFKWPTH